MKHTRIGVLLMPTLLAACALIAPAPAQAEEAAAETLVNQVSVTVETYTKGWKDLVSVDTYGPETQGGSEVEESTSNGGGGIQPMASGNGGTSTASGCRRVTVNNESETVLGFTAFWYHTWTRWCWTRSSQVVSDVTTGWSISDIDSQHYWRGEVNRELTFYDYSTNDGHPRSAYKHYRMGSVENCIVKYGCIGMYYPANTIRSYYNGTWAWKTEG